MPQIPTRTRKTSPDLSGRRVLVIDDDADSLDLFATFLRYCGAEVITASTATDALEHLGREQFDTIVTDVTVLRGGGVDEFLSRVRDIPRDQRPSVIAVTGWARKDLGASIGSSGFSAFMRKPVDLDELAATIQKIAVVA